MTISEEIYRDKVHGCWLGKSIGGTIGGPLEGKTDFFDLPFTYPRETIANDDLDLQLVWLKVLRESGLRITADDLAAAWLDHIVYPFDEYGVALANLKMGLKPPVTGYYNNWFKDSMGSPIRSELWACLFPGRPATAAWYALQDAQVDHWGEGVYGEIFFAALESLAFDHEDVAALVSQALAFIPEDCRVYQAVSMVTRSFADGESLLNSRNEVLASFRNDNFTDAPQNMAFTILGLLHGGGDLLKSVIFAAKCGYDVDCTAATAGAVAGILAGGKAVLAAADADIDDRVVAGWGIQNCDVPETLSELTDQTVSLGSLADQEADLPELEAPFILPEIPPFEAPMRIPCHYDLVPDDIGDSQPLLTESAQEVTFEGAFFDVEDLLTSDDDMLVLETCLNLPFARTLRFIPHCTGPVALWVDNRKVVEWTTSAPFVPAAHRGPQGHDRMNWDMLNLDEGVHEVTIRVKHPSDGRRLELAWLAVDEDNHWIPDLVYELKP
ncbi:MAG: ADP-ribosylglycohydrolase family protein [Lentisphaeria bacterium]|nr:ADP-ribosylglycohydrolase family protein [Lentisphaeria bacterium]